MQARKHPNVVKMNKIDLRKCLKNHPIDETQKVVEQNFLLESLWNLLKNNHPHCVGLYAAIEHEVDLTNIFEQCQKHHILTAYPRITDDQITFHEISSKDMLVPGFHRINEPAQSALSASPDFLIVPGLAFTLDGKRLGRGKGHYDRYLSEHYPITVSLAFSWQVLADLPTEPHDIKIDHIINFR